MTDVRTIIKYLNIFCGIATICIGFYILALVFTTLNHFQIKMIPIYLLPFFLALFGLMVLSCQFEIPALRRNCQFLDHKIGVLLFYVYVGSLVQSFAYAPGLENLLGLLSLFAALAYYALAVLMAVLALLGEQKTNDKIGSIKQKLTAD